MIALLWPPWYSVGLVYVCVRCLLFSVHRTHVVDVNIRDLLPKRQLQ